MEGTDAEVFAELKHNTLLPRQLAAELHMRPAPPEGTALPPEAARSPAQLTLIVSHLAALGYGVTSRVDNTGGQPGCCSRECFARLVIPLLLSLLAGSRSSKMLSFNNSQPLQHAAPPCAAILLLVAPVQSTPVPTLPRCSLHSCSNPALCHASCVIAEFAWLHVERVWPYGAARAAHSRPGSEQSSSSSSTAFAMEEEAQEDAPPRAKRLVVSMASFPGRAQFAAPTVYSIMHGTRKPDALYFWVTVNVSR
jgi:hypothetical protein